MARGGKRAGAGRPTGAIRKATAAAQNAAAATGELPLDYMLRVMRTATNQERRDDMAKAAAPYLHAKLASHEVTGAGGGPVVVNVVTGFADDKS